MTERMELAVRLSSFIAILVLMALWELIAPRRRRQLQRGIGWTNN